MKRLLILVVAASLAALTACNFPSGPNPTITPPPTGTASATPFIISPTPSLPATSPAATQLPPTQTPTPTTGPSQAAAQTVKIFLIAIGDNGVSGKLVGCGDSAVPVEVQIAPTSGVLRAALEQLFAIKTQYYGESGLYDSLYQSNLSIASLEIVDGVAEMRLSGNLALGGECDSPRVQAQLEETALQFSTVQSVEIYINDIPLQDVLSLK